VDNISKLDPRTTSKHQQYELLTTFLYACMEGDINTIKRMITSGYNMNTGDYDKRTGLHIAAAEGHYDIVQLLLENGAQTIVKDRWGNTPYDDAVKG
jgi:glutaminase